jgi:hypothetical protein
MGAAAGKRLALAVSAAVGLGSLAAAGIGTGVVYAHTQKTKAARSTEQSSGTGPQDSSGKSADDGQQDRYLPGDDDSGDNEDGDGGSRQAPPVQVLPGTGSAPHARSSGS